MTVSAIDGRPVLFASADIAPGPPPALASIARRRWRIRHLARRGRGRRGKLPTDFTGGQAAISVDIVLAVRDAVRACQPALAWGDDANWGAGIAFAVGTTGFGVTLEKFHAYCGLMAYYASIEKARDTVQAPGRTCSRCPNRVPSSGSRWPRAGPSP